MIYLAVSVGIALITAGIVFMLGDDILWFLRVLKYKSQGIAVRYAPIMGYMKHVDAPGAEDGLSNWKELFRSKNDPSRTEPIIAVNGAGSHPLLFINDKDLLKDYYKVDSEVTCPTNLEDFLFSNSFVFQAGKRALSQRSAFAEIFYPKYLKRLIPAILGIIDRHLVSVKTRIQTKTQNGGQDHFEVDLWEDIKSMFRDIVTFVLFGGEVAKVEGLSIIDQIESVVVGYYMHNATSLPHKLTGGLYTNLGLSSRFNRLKKTHSIIYERIKELINKCKGSRAVNRDRGPPNVIDLLVEHNEKLEAHGLENEVLSMDEIVDNIVIMIFAGVDTSKNITYNCIQQLADSQQIQSDLRKSVKSEIFGKEGGEESYEAYNSLELLDDFITEALRLYGPAWINSYHLAIKDFKLGKFKISKGTGIRLSLSTLQTRPEYFENPQKFSLAKYSDRSKVKELKRYTLIPFSTGKWKRGCIGKNLAEIVVKMILPSFLERFEVQPTGRPNRRFIAMNYTLQHCSFKVKIL